MANLNDKRKELDEVFIASGRLTGLEVLLSDYIVGFSNLLILLTREGFFEQDDLEPVTLLMQILDDLLVTYGIGGDDNG